MPRRRRRASPIPRSFLRRRSTKWLIAACVTLAVAIVLGAISGRGSDGGDSTPTAGAPTATLSPGRTPAVVAPSDLDLLLRELRRDASRLQHADVVRVIDGDTIDVRVDGTEERVRYYGVDTPERGDGCFSEATDRNEELVGDAVLLLADARERDRYGRLLRYVFDTQGRSIDGQLIAEGLAHAWRQDGFYRDQLIEVERIVSVGDVGCLWD